MLACSPLFLEGVGGGGGWASPKSLNSKFGASFTGRHVQGSEVCGPRLTVVGCRVWGCRALGFGV